MTRRRSLSPSVRFDLADDAFRSPDCYSVTHVEWRLVGEAAGRDDLVAPTQLVAIRRISHRPGTLPPGTRSGRMTIHGDWRQPCARGAVPLSSPSAGEFRERFSYLDDVGAEHHSRFGP